MTSIHSGIDGAEHTSAPRAERRFVGTKRPAVAAALAAAVVAALAFMIVSALAAQADGQIYDYDGAAHVVGPDTAGSALAGSTAGDDLPDPRDGFDDPPHLALTGATRVSRFLAPQTADDDCGPVTLYRAAEPLELEQIISDGYVYGVVDGWSEGKYFFPTSQQATDFARMNPDREYTLTSAEFSRSIFSDPEVWVDNIGGEGEAIFPPEKYFAHGPVRDHGSSP